jgi:hypothetical protein
MGEALTFKNIEQTYALIQKEEFKKPELNPLIYKTNDIKGVILDPILPLEFDVGTDFKEKDILSLKNEHLDEKSFLEWETTFFPYTNEKIFNPDLLKAFSYAQRQKQEEFLSQKDGSFLPIGVLKGVLKKGTDKTVFVFDWLSGVCDDRPDLFIGGLFQPPNQFELGVFSLLNVALVSDELALNNINNINKIKNAKCVMNIEKKKVFGEDFLVNVPNTIKAQEIITGEKVEIKQVGTEEKKGEGSKPPDSSSSSSS